MNESEMTTDIEDLFDIIDRINLDTVWKLPRPAQRHDNLKVYGVLVVGRCTHRIIGQAIATKSNLVISSNYQSSFDQETQLDLWEVAYKDDIYVLEWDWKWLFRSIHGHKILSKLFLCDRSFIAKSSLTHILEISYSSDILIKNIFQQFQTGYALKKHQEVIKNLSVQKLWIVPEWNDRVVHELTGLQERNPLVATFNIPNAYLTQLYYLNCIIIWIEPRDLLNKVSKEFYYILKQGSKFPIDYSNNRLIQIEKM